VERGGAPILLQSEWGMYCNLPKKKGSRSTLRSRRKNTRHWKNKLSEHPGWYFCKGKCLGKGVGEGRKGDPRRVNKKTLAAAKEENKSDNNRVQRGKRKPEKKKNGREMHGDEREKKLVLGMGDSSCFRKKGWFFK